MLPSASSIYRRIFGEHVGRLRALHSLGYSTVIKWLEDCACAVCPGLGSGTPSPLHWSERELDLAIELAEERAARTGEGIDLTDAYAFAVHLSNYFRLKVAERRREGFSCERERCREFARLVRGHAEFLAADYERRETAVVLKVLQDLIAKAIDIENCLIGEMGKERAERERSHMRAVGG